MRPLHLDGMVIFGKPSNWDDEKDGRCNGLPVMNNGSNKTSVWEFTDAERAKIAAGQNLTLTVVGWQPPVLLTVADIRAPDAKPATWRGAWEELKAGFWRIVGR